MEPHIVVTGTDPESRRGGIGVAMPGYLAALKAAGLSFEVVPTYRPDTRSGKWLPWLMGFPRVLRAVRGARAAGRRPIVYCHPGAGISLVRECSLLRFARMIGAATMLQAHSPRIDDYLSHPVQRRLLLWGLSAAQRICVLTPWWRQRLAEAGVANPLAIVPNPLPPELETRAAAAREEKPAGGGEVVRLLTMARLVPGKGVDAVIRAMTHLPAHVRLVVAGDGSERRALEALTGQLNLTDRVRFTGWLDEAAKYALLAASDIFCLPSASDSFGMVFVEAMAFGLPVVALRFGAVSDVVPHGQAGRLVDRPDPESLAEAIERLLPAREEMGRAGRRWVLDRYAAAVVGRALKEALPD